MASRFEDMPVWKPRSSRDWIEHNIFLARDAEQKLAALKSYGAPPKQIAEMEQLVSKRRAKLNVRLNTNPLPSHLVPDIIQESLPYYEDISLEEALKSESLKTGYSNPTVKKAINTTEPQVAKKGINWKTVGKVGKIAAQQVAINLLFPGNFWANLASTGAYESGLYLGKKFNRPLWQRYGMAFAGVAATNIISRFSGKDDEYNTIEGLHPGGSGFGAQLLKANSDFGSGWDAARALAKSIYKDVSPNKAFKMLRQSDEWVNMLKGAKQVKELSSGAYGTTFLMEGTFRGEAFPFIKKIPYQDKIPRAFNPDLPSQEKMISSIKKEFTSLSKAEDRITPSPYGFNKETNELYMELMPGETLQSLMQKGEDIPLDDIVTKIRRESQILAKRGFMNDDIHLGNVMYDKVSGKVSWIDFGLAKRSDKFTAMNEMTKATNRKLTAVPMLKQSSVQQEDMMDWGDLNSISVKPQIKSQTTLELRDKTVRYRNDITLKMQQMTNQQIQNSFKTSAQGARKHRQFHTTGR